MTLLVLLAPFVVLIRTTNGAAEAALSERFETRATLTAFFTRAYIDDIAAREQAQAHRLLGGLEPAQADFDQVVQSLGLEAAVLLDSDGRLLQVWPSRPELIGQDMTVKYAHLRNAVAGQISVSEMVPSAAKGVPVTAVAVPFESVSGRRVFSGAFAPATTPLGAYFASVNPITGGDGFLVDGSGNVLAHGRQTDQFSAALGTLSSGVNEIDTGGGRITAAVAPVAGTPWRVVLTAPTAALYAPVRRGRWAPWALLGALAVCGVLVVLLVVGLGRARVDAGRSARTDALTGLPNRRAMDEMLERAAGHSARHREPLAALMIDLDHFKAINDQHGHHVGDVVLQAAARALRSASRVGDIVARWGGEEFLVLLPATGIDGAVRAAERLRAAVADIRVAVPSHSIDVTTSVGVALLSHSGDVNALLRAADAALYLAKEDGRNAIVVSPSQETTSTHIDLDVEATAPSTR